MSAHRIGAVKNGRLLHSERKDDRRVCSNCAARHVLYWQNCLSRRMGLETGGKDDRDRSEGEMNLPLFGEGS
jgi:hypothetical protein